MNNKLQYILKALELFPPENLEKGTVTFDDEGNASIYQVDPYTGSHIPGTKVYDVYHIDGACDIQEFIYESPSDDLINLAQAFRSILREHFGENAETDQTITKQYVTKYFLQRQVSRTATQFDSGDAQLLNEGFNKISEWTRDGTTWTFPWYILD